jgi:hypothetical protein
MAKQLAPLRSSKTLTSYVTLSGFAPEGLYNFPARHLIPEQYLEEVTMGRIAEMLAYGVSTRDVSNYLQLSPITLKRWIKSDPEKLEAYNLALEVAGEEFAFKAIDDLENADIHSKADVARASAMAEHMRFMAKSYNKDLFSERREIKGTTTAPFVLNVSFNRKEKNVIDLEADAYGEA